MAATASAKAATGWAALASLVLFLIALAIYKLQKYNDLKQPLQTLALKGA